MSRWLQVNKADEFELRYVFANTGQEHPATLDFINECDRRWGLGVEWIESKVIHGKRQGSSWRRTSYEKASRDGAPFESVIEKYGIPNQAYPHCTRELKLNPMRAMAKDTGWADCYWAIGIRADELDRVNPNYKRERLVYPLLGWAPMTKPEIIEWWSRQDFDLQVPERLGNCVWCWKKSLRKHLTNLDDSPAIYDFPERMESLYGLAGHNEDGTNRVFFRGNRSTRDLRQMASRPFKAFVESHQFQQRLFDQVDELDEAGACSESCDAFCADFKIDKDQP